MHSFGNSGGGLFNMGGARIIPRQDLFEIPFAFLVVFFTNFPFFGLIFCSLASSIFSFEEVTESVCGVGYYCNKYSAEGIKLYSFNKCCYGNNPPIIFLAICNWVSQCTTHFTGTCLLSLSSNFHGSSFAWENIWYFEKIITIFQYRWYIYIRRSRLCF